MSDLDSFESTMKQESRASDDFDDVVLDDIIEEASEETPLSTEVLDALNQGLPLYRLRVGYSKDSFHAVWQGEPLKDGTHVVIMMRHGLDLAEVAGTVQKKAGQTPPSVIRIERLATASDIARMEANKVKEKDALDICRKKIQARKLDMKLVLAHYILDESKLIFFFTAESRVDFRELVKDLARVFTSRVELRQIGVRDEARAIGGLSVCGRGFCCNMVSDKLKPVSIKMAKEQNLSLNSMKISGPCSRLLCCLAYEHLFYGEQRQLTPHEGAKINWDNSQWKVTEVNAITGKVRLAADDGRLVQLPSVAFQKVEGHWTIKNIPCHKS